jgi:hypothetical protein
MGSLKDRLDGWRPGDPLPPLTPALRDGVEPAAPISDYRRRAGRRGGTYRRGSYVSAGAKAAERQLQERLDTIAAEKQARWHQMQVAAVLAVMAAWQAEEFERTHERVTVRTVIRSEKAPFDILRVEERQEWRRVAPGPLSEEELEQMLSGPLSEEELVAVRAVALEPALRPWVTMQAWAEIVQALMPAEAPAVEATPALLALRRATDPLRAIAAGSAIAEEAPVLEALVAQAAEACEARWSARQQAARAFWSDPEARGKAAARVGELTRAVQALR